MYSIFPNQMLRDMPWLDGSYQDVVSQSAWLFNALSHKVMDSHVVIHKKSQCRKIYDKNRYLLICITFLALKKNTYTETLFYKEKYGKKGKQIFLKLKLDLWHMYTGTNCIFLLISWAVWVVEFSFVWKY